MNSKWTVLFCAWIISAVATAGSLFFSEVMHFPPCSLCWYQRIAMYPLVLIFLTGLFPHYQKSVIRFSSGLVAVGWFISAFHNLLYYKVLPATVGPCRQGISCTTVQIQWLGFISIPLLALVAFSLIAILLVVLAKGNLRE